MNVRDLLKMSIDINVYTDVYEELVMSFCGPVELTDEGEKKFADALECQVEFYQNFAIVKVDTYDDSILRDRIDNVMDLFNSLSGYCDAEDYGKWFKEVTT